MYDSTLHGVTNLRGALMIRKTSKYNAISLSYQLVFSFSENHGVIETQSMQLYHIMIALISSSVICRSFFAIWDTSSFPASPHRYSSRSSARKDDMNTISLSRSIFRQRWRHSSSMPSFLYSLKYEYRTSSVTPYRLNRSVTLCCVEG